MIWQLDDPVSTIPGVGDNYLKLLNKLDIFTIRDLLFHIPFRYEDWSQTSPIKDLKPGDKVTISVQIHSIDLIHTKNGKKIIKAIVYDQTQPIQVIWFNQVFLLRTLRPQTFANLSGKVD